jgi:hypothetical protein
MPKPGVGTTKTFRDQAVWVASKRVGEDLVFEALNHLFSTEGLERMKEVHPVARGLDPDRAAEDLAIPLHPGAKRYWKSRE